MIHCVRLLAASCAAASSLLPGVSTANTWQLTYELPGAQTTTTTFFVSGVETFDSRPVGTGQGFTSNFGGSPLSGVYSGVEVSSATQFGGANGTSQYAVTFAPSSYSLTLSQPVNYFGYWLSALDAGNVVTFFSGATQVGQFSAGEVLDASVTGNAAYHGNPNAPFLGQNSAEPYAFVNFYSTGAGDTFDRIVFTQLVQGGYESDNHTVGLYQTIGGVPVVPEATSLSLMLAGLAGIGLAARRRRA